MPRAGFWAVGGYTISFRRDGAWYADDERIANPRIQRLFSQGIRRDDRDGAAGLPRYTGWLLDLGVDRQSVVVEDSPLVVIDVSGGGPLPLVVRTNDGEEGRVDPATLSIGRDEALRCRVERGARGALEARFLRPAHYRAMALAREAADGGVELEAEGRWWPVARTDDADRD